MSAPIQRLAGAVYAWALTRQIASPKSRPEVLRLVVAEMTAIADTVRYQQNERELLAARLSRRYDPGMALTEAANRALADKAVTKAALEAELSGRQLAALEFQKRSLKQTIDRA